MRLPGLQLIEQAVEVVAQFVQFGNGRRRHPQPEGAIAPYRMRHIGDIIQRTDNAQQHAAGKNQCAQGTEHQAGDHAQDTPQQETQQAAAVAAQPDLADLFALVGDRQDHRLRQRPVSDNLLQTVQRAILGTMPTGQHVTSVVQDFGFRHLFFGGDQHHRLANVGAISKHHCCFNRIADGARNKVQVVVSVGA
ncbi:hypothetical protein D3C79_812580 [compost metagenome]